METSSNWASATVFSQLELFLEILLVRKYGIISQVVVGARLIMFVQVTIWYIPRHNHLQLVDQVREAGTRGWIFIPALGHQFVSSMDMNKRSQKVK